MASGSGNLSDMVFSSEFLSSDMDITDSGVDPFQSPTLFHLEPKREWAGLQSSSASAPSDSQPPPPPPPPPRPPRPHGPSVGTFVGSTSGSTGQLRLSRRSTT
mmetsp:Transcript_12004/g.34669  ORF Transcript_12004/g.34669 Transcript_12004/m.34669 type:complete len:103 (+) Transcript_12004:212-520(+)